MTEIVKKSRWWTVRRAAVIWGIGSAPAAAAMWLAGRNPVISGPMMFIGIVAFLLGAKAEDDHT